MHSRMVQDGQHSTTPPAIPVKADATRIVIDRKAAKIDATWGFKISLPDGREDHVNGFLNKEDAENWLTSPHFESWLKERGYTTV
jgi:hypothetical protein